MATIDKTTYAYDQGDQEPSYGQPPPQQPPAYGYPPQPVMNQPAASNTVIVQQAAPTVVVQGSRDWSSGTCACCNDMTICLLAGFCPQCYECFLASKMGEICCVPMCVPGSLISMRAHFRGKHNIQGSLIDDCCMSVCCYQCTMCQLSREIDAVSNTQVMIPISPAQVQVQVR